jgi:recombination protein RecR
MAHNDSGLGPLDRVIEELMKLPGIGQKSASRLAFFLLKHPEDEAVALAESIIELKKNIGYCSVCYNVTATDPCPVCSDAKRDSSTVCVVEQPQDVIALERMGEYRGLYHVLLGAISPISGIGPDDLTIDQLKERLQDGGIEEIIIATNATSDGEATAVYIVNELQEEDVSISRIAQGVPVGSNLDYIDSVTMSRSLQTRRKLK